MRGGGTLLFVAGAPGRAETLATIAGVAPWAIEEATSRDVMLGEIKFDHPLFAPLAGAQFNDFTKIHFWKHRLIEPESLGDVKVLARFEAGDAAVIEKTVGKGRLVVFASGWQPVDSQLARSSKFVPLMTGLLEGRTPPTLGGAAHRGLRSRADAGDRSRRQGSDRPQTGWDDRGSAAGHARSSQIRLSPACIRSRRPTGRGHLRSTSTLWKARQPRSKT